MHAKFHQGTIVRPPIDSSHYSYSELPPSSYAVPPGACYTYVPGSGPSSVHHADYQYQTYCMGPDKARCTCGDRTSSQAATAQYYGHHVPLPPGSTPIYPGHQVVYPGEHYQIIGPAPATHYHHHRHHYPPPSSAATHFVPTLHGDSIGAAPRHVMAAPAGCGLRMSSIMTTCSTPIVTGEPAPAQMNNVVIAASDSSVTRVNADDGEPSTAALPDTSTTAEHDITPTRDTSASCSTSATVDSTQLHAYSSGNLLRCEVT